MEWISPAVWTALQDGGTDAHRLASGPDRWLERFGPDLLLSYQDEPVLEEIEGRCVLYDFRPPAHFRQASAPAGLGAQRAGPAPGRGGLPLETEARRRRSASGLISGPVIPPGFSSTSGRTGAPPFLPARPAAQHLRLHLLLLGRGRAGRGETVSIDLSRRSLDRGGEKLPRNGLDPAAGHKFIADDVLAVLPRLARRG